MGARQRTKRKDYQKAWKKNVNVKDDCLGWNKGRMNEDRGIACGIGETKVARIEQDEY